MQEKDRKTIKKKIEEELEKTEQDIIHLKAQTQPVSPENAIGRVSRMDAINNKSINEAALKKAQDKYEKLQQALAKVEDDPQFGICVKCGQQIPAGRIMLMPHARKCVNCA